MKAVLGTAAVYNLLWAAFLALYPITNLGWPEVRQGLALALAALGIGYAVAAFDPYRHWPVVMIGLIGKAASPFLFAEAARHGRLPWGLGWTVLVNDVVWWAPFGMILYGAHQAHLTGCRRHLPEIVRMALRKRTQYGTSLDELSRLSPVVVVFLRHAGCMFCREALGDIATQRRRIEASGATVVLVHMGIEEQAAPFFEQYGLGDLHRVSDPDRSLYRAFGLARGSFWQLFGLSVWWRAIQAGALKGHGVGWFAGDIFQMPGVFVLFHGEVIRGYRHQSVADRPDYAKLLEAQP